MLLGQLMFGMRPRQWAIKEKRNRNLSNFDMNLRTCLYDIFIIKCNLTVCLHVND